MSSLTLCVKTRVPESMFSDAIPIVVFPTKLRVRLLAKVLTWLKSNVVLQSGPDPRVEVNLPPLRVITSLDRLLLSRSPNTGSAGITLSA